MKNMICLLIVVAGFISCKLFAQQPATTLPSFPSSFTVAKDGSGNFKTIQEAVNAVRDLSQQRVKIFIKKGTYNEKIVVPAWKTNISFIGDDAANTIITYNDYSGKPYSSGVDAFGKDKHSTFTSYTVLVQGNDFTAENITMQNNAGRVGQAVALHIEADRVIIKNCRLLGNQDTLFLTKDGCRQFFADCYIEGTTDFIFGDATVIFQRCVIKSLSNSYITAASTKPRQPYGFVFLNCTLVADTGVSKVFLGRPWRPYSNTVFIKTEMGDHILPQGWDNWRNTANERTTFYAEYKSHGPGGNTSDRVKWSKQLSRKEAKAYTIQKVFAANGSWNPE